MSRSPLIECRGVHKHFGRLKAVAGVSLKVGEGEVVGLIGPNGSGKSTLINVISGYYPADGGEIRLRGERIDGIPAHRIARQGIARTYQIPRPFATLNVLDNVRAGCYFGNAEQHPKGIEEQARRWVAFTGLEAHEQHPVSSLTLHQRKFLELARALACRPNVLLLDEVLAGLNAAEIELAIALVRRVREQGVSILLVEHIMRAVVSLCDRVAVLSSGQLIAEGPPESCLQDDAVVTAYLGRTHA